MSESASEQPVSSGRPSSEVLRRLLAYRPFLMAFIVSLVRDFAAAEEIHQDVCVTACERWEKFHAGGDFGAWVREIARRRTLAALKARAKSGKSMPSEKMIDEIERAIAKLSATPQERWETRKEAVRACLHALPAHLRQAIDLRYAKEFSPDQMAAQMGREHAAVREVLARAREELERCVRQKLSEAGGSA